MRPLLLITLIALAAPAASAQPPALPEADRVRLAEAFRLAEAVAGDVWEGWGEVPFAVLLVTPDHEFLVRHPRPSDDFEAIGYDELLGSEVYVRDRVFPPHLLAAFPAVGGVSTVVIGQPEATGRSSTYWVLTALHEHFHQLQTTRPGYYARVAALDLSGGDETGMWMLNYPFPYTAPEVIERVSAYRDALVAALADPDARDGYRAARASLRDALDPADYRYLSFQVWQEGVARYTELRVAEAAARHQPLPAFAALDDVVPYAEAAAELRRQLADELAGLDLAAQQRVAFYPLGAAEALLLDAAQPGWQARYFDEPFYLERYAEDRQSGTSRNGLHYEVAGDGEVVVLIHAFSLDSRMWDAQVEALAPRYRVIRYDLRGHGRSALPDGPFAAHDDLAALLDELGVERATLVGLSAGARVAVDFALTRPERVSRLVLAAPSVSGHVPQDPFAWMEPVIAAARAGDAQQAAERWAETPPMALPDAHPAAATVRALVHDNAHLWVLPSNPERPLDPPAAGRLAGIDVPVLVVVGEHDVAATHEAADLLAASVRGARKEVLPGAGHLVSLAEPEAFNRLLLDFLAAPDPDDVASVDAILAALYDVISGPAGQARDWDRFRGLFAPGGRLIPTGQRRDGERVMTVQQPEDYIRTSGPLLEERGFFEDEIARREERFGNVVHAWSTYEARWTREDPEPFMRGINSIQLFHDGERWWIVTVMWDSERPGQPIPEHYLPDGHAH